MPREPGRRATRPATGGEEIAIPVGSIELRGTLAIPPRARGLVIFAHGSGSGRHSPRNRSVAQRLGAAALATLLFDLLTLDEERIDAVTAQLRFDVQGLAGRLVHVSDWAAREPSLATLPIGYFGASTGAAAALIAAARRPAIDAVVSRGGRPDLADAALPDVRAPTLLIVGGDDPQVLALNRAAFEHLGGLRRLDVVPGATHLFEEPGKLEAVADLASAWFERYATRRAPRWELYPHGADVGIRGFGATADEAFDGVGLALTSAICDVGRVRALQSIEIRCAAPDLEALLYAWVNAVVYEIATRRMLFSRYRVRILDGELHAVATGEPLSSARHEPAVEVKGATYTDLRVREQSGGQWAAQCVIDV